MNKLTALLLLAAVGTFFGCDNAVQGRHENGLKQFRDEPLTITWSGSAKESVESFQANVQVFRKNSRKDEVAGLSETYRIAVKTINEKVMTRIDFDFDDSIPFRSLVSDGEEAIAFNPVTNEIGYRIPMDDRQSPLYRIFGGQTGLSRISLSAIRQEASRLSLSMQEDAASGRLLLEIPPSLIPQNGLDRIVSSRAVFDIANETLVESEVVMVREDDTLVTTTVAPVYEDKDGVPVKVGMVTVIDSKAPGLIEGIDPDMPTYESMDDIPTLSEAELAEMKAAGNLHETSGITFGNPADLSYTETVYEVYRDIEINTVPEQLFRLIQK